MKKQLLVLVTLATLVFTACGNGNDSGNNNDSNGTEAENTLKPEVEENLQELLDEYLVLKDALVEAIPDDAVTRAENMQKVIEEINGQSVQGLKERLHELNGHLKALASTSDIEEQRAKFEGVSNEMYEIVERYRFNSQTVYRQYCPMAFDNRGAYWLSNEEEIRNPYFGDQMLHCGSVEDEIE